VEELGEFQGRSRRRLLVRALRPTMQYSKYPTPKTIASGTTIESTILRRNGKITFAKNHKPKTIPTIERTTLVVDDIGVNS
jgi:hypothetical protein